MSGKVRSFTTQSPASRTAFLLATIQPNLHSLATTHTFLKQPARISIVPNSQVFKQLSFFSYELIFLEETSGRQIVVYNYCEGGKNRYDIVVPCSNIDRILETDFICLLCLYATSIAYPPSAKYRKSFKDMLQKYQISSTEEKKKGGNYDKFVLSGKCSLSDLDLVAFGETGLACRGEKVKRAFKSLWDYFRESMTVELYNCEQDFINEFFDNKMEQIEDMYYQLACLGRMDSGEQLHKYSFQKLKGQITEKVMSIHTQTLADEDCNQAINQGIDSVVALAVKDFQFGNKSTHLEACHQLMQNVLKSLRDCDIRLDQRKYLYIYQLLLEIILPKESKTMRIRQGQGSESRAAYLKTRKENARLKKQIKEQRDLHRKEKLRLETLLSGKQLQVVHFRHVLREEQGFFARHSFKTEVADPFTQTANLAHSVSQQIIEKKVEQKRYYTNNSSRKESVIRKNTSVNISTISDTPKISVAKKKDSSGKVTTNSKVNTTSKINTTRKINTTVTTRTRPQEEKAVKTPMYTKAEIHEGEKKSPVLKNNSTQKSNRSSYSELKVGPP